MYKYLSFILVFFLCGSGVYALTSKQAGKILENFKKQEQEMIFESDRVILGDDEANIFSSISRVQVLDSIGDKIETKREYLEQQNQKIISRVGSLEGSIDELDKDIANLVAEVNNINEQIVGTKSKITINEKKISLLKTKITQSTQVLLDYLVYIYKKGESVSNDNSIDNFKTIILSGENIDDLMNDLYFKSLIQHSGRQLIENHRSFISSLYVQQLELKKDQDTLKALRKQGIIEKNILEDKRDAKQRILSATKGQEDRYDGYIQEKLDQEKDIKIKELEERVKLNNTKKKLLTQFGCEFVDIRNVEPFELELLSDQCRDINKIIYAESRLTGVRIVENPLDWPIQPRFGISAYYRDSEYKSEFGTDHDAIDIVAPQGTDIRAPMDGYVIYIQPPINTGYAYVALKHSDNLVTLYGHVSKLKVKRYDYVKAGQIFAESGGEFGTLGAGVLTTGPHLHFVVFEGEKYVDPLDYLDTSYLDFEKLPDRYEFKYVSDFKTRKGYEFSKKPGSRSNIFRIEGENEIERQKYLLSVYAVGPFQDWDIWIEESVAANIDPTFMMCVGLAETTLGKYLKTPYNIGNVGNTDSGSTYTFSNARQGIHWMTKTFNNRYLSQYNGINELSRYGNKDASKPIYASSDFNWHNNIMKCMTHVKGYHIPDNYSFRLSKN